MQESVIQTEADLTPAVARALRLSRGQSLAEFWGAATVSKSTGSKCEGGEEIPKGSRRLLFLAHVVGLSVDCTDPRNVANLRALAALQGDAEQLVRMGVTRARLLEVRTKIEEAIRSIEQIEGITTP